MSYHHELIDISNSYLHVQEIRRVLNDIAWECEEAKSVEKSHNSTERQRTLGTTEIGNGLFQYTPLNTSKKHRHFTLFIFHGDARLVLRHQHRLSSKRVMDTKRQPFTVSVTLRRRFMGEVVS